MHPVEGPQAQLTAELPSRFVVPEAGTVHHSCRQLGVLTPDRFSSCKARRCTPEQPQVLVPQVPTTPAGRPVLGTPPSPLAAGAAWRTGRRVCKPLRPCP